MLTTTQSITVWRRPALREKGGGRLALMWVLWAAALLWAAGPLQAAEEGGGVIDPNRQPSSLGAAAPMEYVLCSRDVIMIRVFEEPELETKAVISQDGTITMPLLGSVKVGGIAVGKATRLIRDLLAKDYIVDPQVNLSVLESKQRQFTVMGQVQRPGVYSLPLDQPMQLLDAIATGGGFTARAAPSKVTVQRKVEGETKVFKLDAGSMGSAPTAKPFEILPNDTIVVGEKVL